jgi:hypothetical protein
MATIANRNGRNMVQHAKKIRIGGTIFAAVTMETKKGGFKKILDSFHQTS